VPEVAGDCGVYINIDRADQTLAVIRDLIHDDKARMKLEAKIRRDYVPITWRSVAERVVSACEASVAVEWQEPYPYTALPYSTEVSFGRLDQDVDGTGELVLSRIVDARLGHFKYEPLDQQSFLLGEAIRSGGAWSEPERWGTWLCHSGRRHDVQPVGGGEPVRLRVGACAGLRAAARAADSVPGKRRAAVGGPAWAAFAGPHAARSEARRSEPAAGDCGSGSRSTSLLS